ncbi:hypothetical protein B5S31_g5010 [[Candida] boidinii]|nr:hypothetical protein B5S31_g5010 [[Candida] boidinii]
MSSGNNNNNNNNNNTGDPLGDTLKIKKPEGVYPLNGDEPTSLNLNLNQSNLAMLNTGYGNAGTPGSSNSMNMYNNNNNNFNNNNNNSSSSSSISSKEFIYPDFRVWKHAVKDDQVMRTHLQKGYWENPIVSNESHSGRQIVSQLLHRSMFNNNNNNDLHGNMNNSSNNNNSLNNNSTQTVKLNLKNLSDVMVRAIVKRREINKIKSKSTYKPPPRVTLTEHKREIWLKNLSDINIPLKQLSRASTHIKNNLVN